MNASRTGLVGVVVLVAVLLQVAVFSLFSVNGVVPNLALLVVVAAAIARGPQFGAFVGFFAGLLLDLAPPADHVAGRWALAFVLVGRPRRPGARRRPPQPGRRTGHRRRRARSWPPRSSRSPGSCSATTRCPPARSCR